MYLLPPFPGCDRDLYRDYLNTFTVHRDASCGLGVGWTGDCGPGVGGITIGLGGPDVGRVGDRQGLSRARMVYSSSVNDLGDPVLLGVNLGDVGASGLAAAVETGGVAATVSSGVTNKKKKKNNRKRKAALKKAKAREDECVENSPEEKLCATASVDVPEWRRRDVKATFHKSVFADCSDETRERLRESRARMLVARNEAAVVQAEHDRRRLEARLQSQVVEREVEAGRLRADAESKRLLHARLRASSPGFAETVISGGAETIFSYPSLSSGSVSPNSSVSVEQVVKMERLIERLLLRVGELEAQVKKPVRESSGVANAGKEVSGETQGSMLGNAAGVLAPGLTVPKPGVRVRCVADRSNPKIRVVKPKYDASGFPLENGYGLP